MSDMTAGIDIAARSFVLAWQREGHPLGRREFKQTPEGHRAAIKQLKRLTPARIVLEATGVYYLDLAMALAEAKLPVAVINPKRFHHFARMCAVDTKTDNVDAALLALYAERMRPPLWQPPAPTYVELRAIGRQINRLTHQRTQAKNQLHALASTAATPKLLLADQRHAIAELERRIARLTEAAEAVIAREPALARHFTHFTAATGIGATSALALIAELAVVPTELKSAQVSRQGGLDVRLTQSGTSVDKPGRLSKSGNAYLRSALYMPALSAVRFDRYAHAFYQALIARGKKKIQALCAVMRKYLTGLWACLKTDTPFDSALLFSDKHLTGGLT